MLVLDRNILIIMLFDLQLVARVPFDVYGAIVMVAHAVVRRAYVRESCHFELVRRATEEQFFLDVANDQHSPAVRPSISELCIEEAV